MTAGRCYGGWGWSLEETGIGGGQPDEGEPVRERWDRRGVGSVWIERYSAIEGYSDVKSGFLVSESADSASS